MLDDSNHVIGTVTDDGYKQYHFDEPRLAAAWSMIAGVFPGRQLTLSSHTPDYSKIVVYVEGTGEPGGYYLLDLTAKKLSKVGSAYPGLAGAEHRARCGQIKLRRRRRPDDRGLSPPCPRARPKNLPLIVLPPRRTASPRRSRFLLVVSRPWRRAATPCCSPTPAAPRDAARPSSAPATASGAARCRPTCRTACASWPSKGIVDPKRVCITGASYGGYAALAGITMDKGVYRCAVSVAGIGDLRQFLDFELLRYREENPTIRYYKRIFGIDSVSDL